MLATSLDPTFDRAIVAAVDSIAADGYLFEPPLTMRGDSALLRLHLVRAEDAAPDDDALVLVLRTRVPRHVVADSVGAAVGDTASTAPGGTARLAAFVVDTAGVPLPRTVRLPGFDDAAAVQALLDALPRLRYRPASVAGCRVPTLVTRPLAPGGSPPLRTADGSPVYYEFQVERPVEMRALVTPPRYPEELKLRNVQGEVLMQFVVDTAGRVIPETMRVLRADHPRFVAAVRTSLLSARFVPARSGGHPVAQLVQQPFQFALTRGPGMPDIPGVPLDAVPRWPYSRP